MNPDPNQGYDPLHDPKWRAGQAAGPDQARMAVAQSGVITAVIMIVVGVVLLLHQMGIIPRQFVPHLAPALFILAGIVLLANAGSSNIGIFYGGRRAVKSPANNVFWGAVLIVIGFIVELNLRNITHVGWEVFWPLAIITGGAYLLWHHARGVTGWTVTTTASSEYPFDLNFVFSGTDRQIADKDFKGGRINAVFGGFKIDLSNADMKGDQAVMEVHAVFGGGEIIVPPNWEVTLVGSGVFGGVEDKTRRYPLDPALPKKRLIIRSATVFGGFTVRN